MQVSVESAGGLKRRMKVQVPAEQVDQEVDKRLRSLSRKARIKGFRPGKVPLKVVRQQYGDDVRSEVVGEIMQRTYAQALSQQKLNPASNPHIHPLKNEPGAQLEYEASFEVFPEIEVRDIDGEKIERPKVEITEDDVDWMIENLRRQNASWETVERAAADGDRVIIDFEGTIKDESFPGSKGEKTPVELGGGRMLEDFEKGLKGAEPGQDMEIKVKFPKDYGHDDVAGQKAVFKVRVHEVQTRKLPALDDQFCAAFGIDDGGVDKLREEVRENMARELDQTVKGKLKDQVMEALLTRNKVELPEAMVDREIEALKQESLQRMGINDPQKAPELPRDMFEERARRRVSLGLLISDYVRRHQLKADPERVDRIIDDLTGGHDSSDQLAAQYRANPQAMQQVESMALEEQVVEHLLEAARIKDVEQGFRDLMNFRD
jgi:trigger factor